MFALAVQEALRRALEGLAAHREQLLHPEQVGAESGTRRHMVFSRR